MAELVIALVVLMVLVAGILQVGTLGIRHTRVVNESRREAARLAMGDAAPLASPRFMADRTEGDDATRYSRDDEYTPGDVNAFLAGIAAYADPDDLGRHRPDNPVSAMAGSPYPHLMFGLVEGRQEDSVPLWPIVRHLLYGADEVEVRGETWLIWTRGIY